MGGFVVEVIIYHSNYINVLPFWSLTSSQLQDQYTVSQVHSSRVRYIIYMDKFGNGYVMIASFGMCVMPSVSNDRRVLIDASKTPDWKRLHQD